jgi:energy-coupling factor transporter ATP-binding protein EcfA2
MKILGLKASNYKTLCDLSVSFSKHFTAICGPNDSGKSNIVKAIRALLEADDYYPAPFMEITVKDDYPVWNQAAVEGREIKLEVELSIDRDRDIAIHQVVCKQLTLEDPSQELRLTITLRFSQKGMTLAAACAGKESTGLEADQILKALRAAGPLLYHNSTSVERPYRRRRDFYGMLTEVSPDYQRLQAEVQTYVDNRLKKVIKGHQKEISELLGRLESKYDVGIAIPKFDFDYMPFGITLGDKNAAVPLNDWGSGTQNRTQILLQLFRAKQVSQSETSASKVTPVLMIEEPECFLHPSAQAEFGRILRDLAEEFEVQVIITTHSPYMLSHQNPASNILLNRRVVKKQKLDTVIEEVTGDQWAKPFALALGVSGNELTPWRDLFFAAADSIFLVEGPIDKAYFELLRSEDHGENRFRFTGEIFAYDGYSSLTNTLLVRFIKNKYSRVFITVDLDALAHVEKTLQSLELKKDVDYMALGVNSAGRRAIEGYLPDNIVNAVNAANTDLVRALSSDNKEEIKEAKRKLKEKYLAEFKASAKPGSDDFAGFYPLVKKLNKLCGL